MNQYKVTIRQKVFLTYFVSVNAESESDAYDQASTLLAYGSVLPNETDLADETIISTEKQTTTTKKEITL